MTGDRPGEMIAAAQPPALEDVHALLEAVWAAHPEVTPEDRILFEIAVIEVAGNIASHSGDGGSVTFSLRIDVQPDRIEALFRDNGGLVELPDASVPVDDLAESGRGMGLIADAVDDVEYRREDEHNLWRLVKTRT